MSEVEIHSESADATRALGARLGHALLETQRETPLIIYLRGDLGAGKTTFVGGLLCAVGVTGSVRSPTYTLIEPYELGSLAIYHLDLYRLADARELDMLALRDLLVANAVLLVEWPERGQGGLPPADLTLELSYPAELGDQRTLNARSNTAMGECLLNKLVANGI